MSYCVGLQREQLADLECRAKKAGCSKASFLYYAIKRWKRGDFLIPEEDPKEKDIVPLTIWKKIDLPDWQIRCILQQHFQTPDSHIDRDLQRQNRICDEMIRAYIGKPFVVEEQK